MNYASLLYYIIIAYTAYFNNFVRLVVIRKLCT